jgi:hypothetical protein
LRRLVSYLLHVITKQTDISKTQVILSQVRDSGRNTYDAEMVRDRVGLGHLGHLVLEELGDHRLHACPVSNAVGRTVGDTPTNTRHSHHHPHERRTVSASRRPTRCFHHRSKPSKLTPAPPAPNS